ncbi:hypothetical protein ACOMHN_061771 [Nucella lapillus]
MALAAQAECYKYPVAFGEVQLRCSVSTKPDKELPDSDPNTVGKDLAGSVISATIASRLRGKLVVYNRKEAKDIILEETYKKQVCVLIPVGIVTCVLIHVDIVTCVQIHVDIVTCVLIHVGIVTCADSPGHCDVF